MRLRLLVPKDGEKESGGLREWFRNLFAPSQAAAPPESAPEKPDKRWSIRGKACYFPLGRLCTRRQGQWQAEYIFEVQSRGEKQRIRVILPEPLVAEWEQRNGQRMPEARRQVLARTTLEALLDLERVPAAIDVSRTAIEAVEA